MITEQKLKEKGYERYKAHYDAYGDFFYQKKFTDKTGIKYFVNIIHHPPLNINGGSVMAESWSAKMTVNDPYMEFEMHWIQSKSVGHVEKKMKTFWEAMGKHYYEKYNR